MYLVLVPEYTYYDYFWYIGSKVGSSVKFFFVTPNTQTNLEWITPLPPPPPIQYTNMPYPPIFIEFFSPPPPPIIQNFEDSILYTPHFKLWLRSSDDLWNSMTIKWFQISPTNGSKLRDTSGIKISF